jgi:NTP pyrophosphatase (non-canonical NTP hydrolase)
LASKTEIQQNIWFDILAERDRQDVLHSDVPRHNDLMFVILGEEMGEVAKEVFECNYPNLRTELVQVAAVAVKWLETIDKDNLV